MKYYLAIKINDLSIHTARWMNSTIIVLSKKKANKKRTNSMTVYIKF